MAYVPYAVTFGDRYELVGPDGSVAVFNEDTHPSYVGMLTEVTGLDSPEVRESAQDIVEGDGGVHGNFYFSRRPITMTTRIFGHGSLAERAARIDRARRATIAMRDDATLKWKPATRRENFIWNPDFSGGAAIGVAPFVQRSSSSGWAVAPTIAYSGTNGVGGGASLRFQATQPADTVSRTGNFGHGSGTTAQMTPVVPGRSYYLSANVNHIDAPGLGSRVQFAWFKADGTASATATSTGTYVGPGATGNFTPTLTSTAPADAAYADPRFQSNTATSGDVIDTYWDQIFFTETLMGTTYFSGSTAGFHWQGTPNQSAAGDFVELYVPVRRQQPFRETGQWIKEVQMSLVSEFAVIQSAAQLASPSTASGTGVAIENKGSYVVYPIIEITAVSSNPTVTDGHGNTFTTGPSGNTLTLASGETVQFDMLNHTGTFIAGARNGQSANRYINFATTAWPNLRGGTTETFTLSGGGTMVVRWRHAWV